MALSAGARLGVYEIVGALGAGGMGEVYRATDTRLKRQVAIKILPPALAADPDRLARFQREAEVLASLNHPNIAGIYGLERLRPSRADSSTGSESSRAASRDEDEEIRGEGSASARAGGGAPAPLEESWQLQALVMELVEGEDLSQRIAHGAIPFDEALPIAKQIADALEAAHEQGIIHRDLKPANVKVRADGTVKVLDFGLAKAIGPAEAGPHAPDGRGIRLQADLSQSPTITTPAMTQMGMILGTAAYMSPEQARGKTVDKRADIWAFGAVLYEMLTGRRAFDPSTSSGSSRASSRDEDATIADVLAFILQREPDFDALPSTVPARVSQTLRVCLRKDPKQRAGDIRDVRLALEGAFETAALAGAVASTPVANVRVRLWQQPAAVAALAVVAVISVALAAWALQNRGRTETRPSVRLTIPVQSDVDLDDTTTMARPALALSPDGRVLVYAARRNGVVQLYRRPLDQFSSAPIAGTDGAAMPFFSPDGQWIGFFAGGEMKKIQASGGEPITVTKSAAATASWGDDDGIVFGTLTFGSTLKRASAAGGDASPLTMLDASRGDVSHFAPEILPGGRAVLFHAVPSGKILARSLPDGDPKELIEGVWPRFLPTGHLAFIRGTSLWAAPFSVDRLEVTGPPVRLVEGVLGAPVVAHDGTLVYVSGAPSRAQLVWVTRQGKEEAVGLDAADFSDVALSPDGRLLVVSRGDQVVGFDLWIGDFARRTLTRLTTEVGFHVFPLWTRDGRSVVYSSTIGGGRNIFRRAADGSGKAERLTQSANQQSPWTWSKDGRTLVLNELRPTTSYDLVAVPADGAASVLFEGPRSDRAPAVSPDGRWIGYQTDESGTNQVVVRPFPNVAERRWQVSTDGGGEPKWSADGRELFYRRGAAVMRVPIGDNPGVARPEKLFEGDYVIGTGAKSWDVAPDGRFLMKKSIRAEYSINVVLNWTEELKRLVPTK